MPFLIRIQPVAGNPRPVARVLVRLLGPGSEERARTLVERGGVVLRGLNQQAAGKAASELEEAGARVTVTLQDDRPGEQSFEVRVRDARTGKAAAGVTVALYAEEAPAEPLATGVTDRAGRAVMEGFAEAVDARFPDERPVIVARVTHEGQDAEVAHKPFQWGAYEAGGYTFVLEARFDETDPDAFVVRGTVVLPTEKPAAGYRVRAEDRDLRRQELLGEAVTDGEGRYEITYRPVRFGKDEKGRADLHLRVFTHVGRELPAAVVGRDVPTVQDVPILFNAEKEEEVNLTIASTPKDVRTSLYEEVVAALSPLPDGLVLSDLTPDDVRFLHHDTGRSVEEVAFAADDARLGPETGLPEAVFFGLAMQQVGVTFLDDAGGESVPQIVLDAVLERSVDALMEAVDAALEEALVPAALQDEREAIRTRFVELKGGARATTTPEGLHALRDLAGRTLEELGDDQPPVAALVRDRAASAVRRQLDAAFASAPADVRSAVGAVDLHRLDPETDLRTVLTDALEARGASPQAAREVRVRLASADVPRSLGEVMQPGLPLERNPLLTGDLRRARHLRVGALAGVDEGRLLNLLGRDDGPHDLSDGALTRFVDAGDLAEDEAGRIGFASDLYGLVERDDALADALRAASFDGLPDGRLTSTRDLARLSAEDLEPVVEQAGLDLPDGTSARDLARRLAARFEYLHPDEALFHRTAPKNGTAGADALGRVDDLLTSVEAPFDPSFDLPDGTDDAVRDDFVQVRGLANTFAGLGVQDVLQDPDRSPEEKAEVVGERLKIFQDFRAANADHNLLALDLTPGSDALDALDWGSLADEERTGVMNTLKSFQRTYAVARSAPLADALLATGYHSAIGIAGTSFDAFVAGTGLDVVEAQAVYAHAQAATGYVTSVAGSVLDILKGGFADLGVGNVGPSIEDFLRELDGYEDLFGSLDFCNCEHCQSILGPAAYFVDLMLFIEGHVLDKHFDGGDSDDTLNLKVRRPDLWTLELTCEHTNTLLPTLTVVNEVLENYIATRRGYNGSLAVGSGIDRSALEDFVYRERLAATTSSFEQPFLLPLRELEVYLSHFDRTRADVAVALGAPEAIETRARLGLSRQDYDLVTTLDDDLGFLEALYGLDFGVNGGTEVEPFDAQELLGPTGLAREELGRLVATAFVSPADEDPVEIRSEKRDADSVQNDIERIHDLTLGALDRMHRFTRLWRALPWRLEELDLVVEALQAAGLGGGLDAGILRHVAWLAAVQERLGTSVEETLALWTAIPRRAVSEDADPLFDRLFNAEGFVGIGDPYPQPGTSFVHPAWDSGSDTAPLHRLVAGLRVSDEALYTLVVHLAGPLGVDLESADPAEKGFALTEANLALLYRHARLAEHLDLDVAALFQLLSFLDEVADDHVDSFGDLRVLLDGYERWEAAPYALDDLGGITGGSVLDAGAHPDPVTLATALVEAVAQDGALTFADTLFAYLGDLSEADSRAILGANDDATVEVAEADLLRLADDFDTAAALSIPAGVAVDEGEARAVLVAYHVSEVLPAYLATQLGTSVEKTQALLALMGADLHDAALAAALRGGAVDPLAELIEAVYSLHLLFEPDDLTADDVAFAEANTGLFELADVANLTPEAAWRVAAYHRLLSLAGGVDASEETTAAHRVDLQDVLLAHDPAAGFSASDPLALAGLFGVEDGLIVTLREALDLTGVAVHALERLGAAVELARYLGVGGEALRQIAGEDYETLALARDAVLGAFRAKYSDEQTWLNTVEPFADRILVLKRDALVDYLLHAVHPEFDDAGDLYHHFLLDVEVDSCARTSRVVEATASLQLYVHRILMNLEQDRRDPDDPARTHVQPQAIPADEWAWRKNYRVWEANRKVFLYPETYIEPELRDNKTPLFKELEATLLQKPVDEQAVLDAYAQYVRGFEEVARLQVAGAYHDEGSDTDVLHLFGVTASEPPQFYYRTIENLILSESDPTRGVVYGPWRKVEVQIPVRRVAPVVFRGTLYLFWVEITTRPKTDFVGGDSKFEGYNHNFAFKYTAYRLDGTWTAPQALDLSAYARYPFEAGPGVLFEKVKEREDGLMRPYYDTIEHEEPREGYTLTGPRFDRLYPDPHEDEPVLYLTGVTYKVHAAVDFYTNALSDRKGAYVDWAVRWTGSIERGKLITTRSHQDHWDLYLSTPDEHLFDDYAYASIVADSRRIDAAALNWDPDGTLESDLRGDLYQHYLSRLPAPTDVTVVNGAVSDALIDLDGDILYVQGSARDGERALVRRMGTTLAEDVGRTLVTQGVGGLLALDAQRAFQEAASALYDVGSRLDDAVNAGALDFTGPYGTYYRELFFHVPFLIADHLNSQRHFAEAQKWYHYLFDPTAPVEEPVGDETEEDAVRDRPWRYLEFRGLDAQTLREQLTDPAAIETYEKDPFNPHAIARLRLSAYQKAVVMKYVDNLLDWGDALFARDTRESITEAMLLYMMASDILGDRPAELGSCGEGKVTPKTYESIAPLIEEDSPFLIELEHFTFVHTPLVASAVPAGTYTLGTAGVADVVHAANKLYGVTYTQPFAMRAAAPAAGTVATPMSVVDEPDLGVAVGDGLRVAAEVGEAGAPGLVYRSDWARTKTASWQGAGTPLAQNPAVAGTVTTGTAAAGAAVAGTTVQPGGIQLDGVGALGGAMAWGTHLRPDLLDDLRLPSFGISLMRQVSPVFCVPANAELGAYWDRVEDRLYKIRHCMNISGVRRQLALFAPPIDPRLLVRARAAGLSLEDALGLTAGELPPYRFAALIGRAKAYAQTVQGFGAALLGALEKKDAEELARLRLVHQENLAKLATQVREQEVEAAAKALEALQKRKATVEYRKAYYQGLVDAGLLSPEQKQVEARSTAATLNAGAALLDTLAAVLYLIPEVGAPTAMKYGGKQTGSSGFTFAEALRDGAKLVDSHSALHGLRGGHQRRAQGWEHQVALAEKELDALEPQIEAAEIRWEIAVAQLAVHERSIEQVQEVFDFYGEKFSGLGLYTWLSSTLQRLYREAYNSALAMARLAEQAFRFERRDLTDVGLGVGHWDATRAGLLAGEQLLLDLQAMERRFIETDDRRLEVDQAFSLQQIDPAALIQLKETGTCTFTLPERFFDLFYPGQYRRVVKAVRLTVPCVTGPYVNVSATLSLLGSEVRLDADPAAAPMPAPASRTTTVAASTAQNDAGVFELSFRGERYLPFEGAGAVNSQWRLTLPTAFRPFDYDSINDVLLRISYTAEYDETLKDHVETENDALEGTLTKVLKDEGMARAFRFRQELSSTFHRLLQADLGEAVPFEITEQHFPLFLRGRDLAVKRALLAVQPADGAAPGGLELAFDGTVIGGFAALPELGGLPGADLGGALAGDPRGDHTLEVRDAGDLGPDDGTSPALSSDEVEDLVLYIEYGLDV